MQCNKYSAINKNHTWKMSCFIQFFCSRGLNTLNCRLLMHLEFISFSRGFASRVCNKLSMTYLTYVAICDMEGFQIQMLQLPWRPWSALSTETGFEQPQLFLVVSGSVEASRQPKPAKPRSSSGRFYGISSWVVVLEVAASWVCGLCPYGRCVQTI